MPLTRTHPRRAPAPVEDVVRFQGSTHARRPLVVVASLVLMAISVAVFAGVYAHAGSRVSVLAVAHDVALGQIITSSDVVTTRVSVSSGLATIPAADLARVVGHQAGVALEKGTLLAFGEVGGVALPPDGAIVGVATKVGELPAEGVAPGESVEVVLIDPTGIGSGATQGDGSDVDSGNGDATPGASVSGAPDGSPTDLGSVVVPVATVTGVADDASSDGTVIVSVLVSKDLAPVVAAASAEGDAAIVVVGATS